MSESNKNKEQSPLVQSVVSLDGHFTQLERLSEKIDEIKLKSETDFAQVRRLMARFAEHGEAVSQEIVELSNQLQNARARAEAAAAIVSAKAEILQARQDDEEKKMATFRALAEKVNVLGQGIKDLRRPEGEAISEEERAQIVTRMAALEFQLQPLIEEAQNLKNEAHESRMKGLEQQAESLTQSLINVSQKLAMYTESTQARQ